MTEVYCFRGLQFWSSSIFLHHLSHVSAPSTNWGRFGMTHTCQRETPWGQKNLADSDVQKTTRDLCCPKGSSEWRGLHNHYRRSGILPRAEPSGRKRRDQESTDPSGWAPKTSRRSSIMEGPSEWRLCLMHKVLRLCSISQFTAWQANVIRNMVQEQTCFKHVPHDSSVQL